jgi:hypothetical protein
MKLDLGVKKRIDLGSREELYTFIERQHSTSTSQQMKRTAVPQWESLNERWIQTLHLLLIKKIQKSKRFSLELSRIPLFSILRTRAILTQSVGQTETHPPPCNLCFLSHIHNKKLSTIIFSAHAHLIFRNKLVPICWLQWD